MKEQWKPAPGWNGYEASSLGQIRSTARIVTSRDGRTQSLKGKVLKQKTRKDGYQEVNLYLNGYGKSVSVHRLVLSAFHGESELACNHKDGNPKNNNVENLEWLSHLDNVRHSYDVLKRHRGEAHERAVLSAQDVLEMRRAYVGDHGQIASLARQYGVHFMTASNVLRNITWKVVTP